MKEIKTLIDLLEGNFALTERLILNFGDFIEVQKQLKLFRNHQI